jgi:hypothetical protein
VIDLECKTALQECNFFFCFFFSFNRFNNSFIVAIPFHKQKKHVCMHACTHAYSGDWLLQQWSTS